MKIKKDNDKNSEILKEITDAVSKIKYGEIVITLHDSKIVQIEEREKKRFDNSEKRR